MSWNYRLLHKDGLYGFAEVYYNDAGKPGAYSDPGDYSPMSGWQELDDITFMLEKFGEAMEKPTLDVIDGKLVET